jgi:type VI secretion system protein ImpB
LPQLNKLRELRDALVALKGPLAEKPGLCERIESVFFNNEVNDRVLGKRVCEPLDIYRPLPGE